MLELRRRQLRKEPIGLNETMERVGTALDNAKAAAKIAQGVAFAIHVIDAGEQATGNGLDGSERVRELVAKHANQSLPGCLLFFLKRQTHIGQEQQGVRHTILAKRRLTQQPPRRSAAEGVDALVRRRQQHFESEFASCMAETARVGEAEKLDAGVVHQLQQVFAIECEQRGVHDLEYAGKQRSRFERTHALLLQQVGQCVDLSGKLTKGITGCGSAGTEGVVAFAQ